MKARWSARAPARRPDRSRLAAQDLVRVPARMRRRMARSAAFFSAPSRGRAGGRRPGAPARSGHQRAEVHGIGEVRISFGNGSVRSRRVLDKLGAA